MGDNPTAKLSKPECDIGLPLIEVQNQLRYS